MTANLLAALGFSQSAAGNLLFAKAPAGRRSKRDSNKCRTDGHRIFYQARDFFSPIPWRCGTDEETTPD
jgi:hypothetical protein